MREILEFDAAAEAIPRTVEGRVRLVHLGLALMRKEPKYRWMRRNLIAAFPELDAFLKADQDTFEREAMRVTAAANALGDTGRAI